MRISPTLLLGLIALVLWAPLAPPAFAQPTGATLVTGALNRPIGIAVDAQGRVWVAEAGTTPSSNDGQISVVLPGGQVFPFLTGLPTGGSAAEQRGVNHVFLDGDDLWFTHTTSGSSGFLYQISTAGFTPGDAPRTPADIAHSVDVAGFVFAEGYTDSNAYGIAKGPDGALYLTDAGANVVLRYDLTTGLLSVVAAFPDLPNPTPVGPPAVNVVPTGIVAADGRLYVSTLTGFPFVQGLARVYAVELNGSFSIHEGGLTTLTDLARDPRDGALTALQHGVFVPPPPPPVPGWQPASGRVLRLDDGQELAYGFDLATGIAYNASGVLYVTTLGGALYQVASQSATCSDPATMPFYPGGYELSADASRAFIFVYTGAGGTRYEFYNVHNLNIGDPEDASETPLPGVTRTGTTFDVAPGEEQFTVYFPITTAGGGTSVRFYLRVTDTCGRTVDVDPAFTLTGIERGVARAFNLGQSHPNPASVRAVIGFTLDAPGEVRLSVYDVLGREVAMLVEQVLGAGEHAATVDATMLAPGVYVYRLDAGEHTLTRTLTITR